VSFSYSPSTFDKAEGSQGFVECQQERRKLWLKPNSGFLNKTTAIDSLFHIRLLFSEPITSSRLELFKAQLASQTQPIAAQGKKRELRGRFPKSAGRTA
jgi:hypothetical protein